MTVLCTKNYLIRYVELFENVIWIQFCKMVYHSRAIEPLLIGLKMSSVIHYICPNTPTLARSRWAYIQLFMLNVLFVSEVWFSEGFVLATDIGVAAYHVTDIPGFRLLQKSDWLLLVSRPASCRKYRWWCDSLRQLTVFISPRSLMHFIVIFIHR